MNPEYLERRDAVCTRCAQGKRPTRAHLRLLKHAGLPYVCKACRMDQPVPPMSIGKLGVI